MTIVDWRQVDARALALVFARERARWLVDLHWETRESWLHVERARTTWGLPGLAALDDGGRVRGLTFVHEAGGRYDIGGVFADSRAIRDALIDAVISVCVDAGGDEVSAFLYAPDSSVASAFRAREFTVDSVDYLTLALDTPGATLGGECGADVIVREWRADDVQALGALLHVSYDPTSARRFVPDVTTEGWRHYITTLVEHGSCGRILAGASRMAFVDRNCVAAVLVTDLGPGTAHIPQVAVHPGWRRQGLAGALIDQAAGVAGAAGYHRMSLLASGSNAPAQALYRNRGYVSSGAFVAVSRGLARTAVAQAS